ncbi:MAG: TRAP-type mannitol/chloroaromatic compound transport system permease small subunit [Gammaproteobacteria bacterium]
MNLPETRLSRLVDPLVIRIGEAISWLWLMLMITIVGNVVLRYAFGEGRVEFEEIQWHIYACGFLLGLAYAYQADSHIRVDVLHERLTERTRAWIELYGTLLFVLPFTAVILIFGVPFVTASYHMQEVSQAPGGLPLRWLIKAALPAGFALLLIATVSRLSQVWSLLFLTPEAPRGAK